MKGSLSLDLPLYSTLRSSLWLWTTRTSHHAPEEQHQGLEERPEVVVPVDAGVVIQSDVSKHLQRRQTALQTSAAGCAGAVARQETVGARVGAARPGLPSPRDPGQSCRCCCWG